MDRPFKEGDIIDLYGHGGKVLAKEENGLVLVRVQSRIEPWTADHCKLISRTEPDIPQQITPPAAP